MTSAPRRLGKRHVEQLLDRIDSDPEAALTEALRVVLGRPDASWPQLVAAAPLTDEERHRLLDDEVAARDALTARLVEQRTL
jgi:hypothetical protein